MKVRVIAWLLCALTVLGAMASCAEDVPKEQPRDTETTVADSQTEPPETRELTNAEKRQMIPDGIEEITFDGRPYRIGTDAHKEYEIISEDLNGEITNDEIYNRNGRIEDRFLVTIESVVLEDPSSHITNNAASGDLGYELVGFYSYMTRVPAVQGVLYNWMEIPGVDLSKPWHNQLANEVSTINGKLFTCNSDLSVSTLLYTYAMFFNYDIMEDNGYSASQLYDIVFANEWTFERFYEIVSGIYTDVNASGTHDPEDIHGYAVTGTAVNPHDVWVSAFDIPLLSITSPDEYEILFFSEKTVDAIEKINKLYHETRGTLWDRSEDWRNIPLYFSEGKVAMTQMYFGETMEGIANMEDTYGVLPLPKYDENQKTYYTGCWDQFTVFAVPISMEYADGEFVGTIYEALSAESYKYVYPAYYDVVLKNRYSAEPTTAQMIDLIMEGRKMDITFQYGAMLQRLPYLFRDMVVENNSNVSSKYRSIQSPLKAGIKNFLKIYRD